MAQGILDPKNYAPDFFDVIVSIEVIEHINNPKEEIQNFGTILRHGGVVYLTTPNFNSISRIILKEKWNVLGYPEHLCYYTPGTITRLFNDHHFKKLSMETTGISVTRMKSSLSGSHETGIASTSTDEKLRRTLESNFILRAMKSLANSTLTFTRRGDNLKATFVKE